jgi:hypothetical protein
MKLSWKTLPLTDETVAAHLAAEDKVMLDSASKARGGRSHLTLHQDRDGYFVRVGGRGSCKQYLGHCKVTYFDGVATLFAYTLADHDAFQAAQAARFDAKHGIAG